MAEINILFPTEGKPIVMPDPEAVVTDRPFTFTIKNENPAVKFVAIEFADRKVFTSPSGPTNVFEKPLPTGKQTAIWAVVPAGLTTHAKYTVLGKTHPGPSGSVVTALDPKILPTDP